jgi:hypothetical protein
MNKRTQMAALNALQKLLKREAKKMGFNPDGIFILPAGHSESYPLLSWEEGPYEWASALTGGSWLYAGETGQYSKENPWFHKVEAISEKYGTYFECQNHFQLCAWEG